MAFDICRCVVLNVLQLLYNYGKEDNILDMFNLSFQGMMEKGWQTAYGAYHTCYERYGLGFQTPEAYFCDQRYRSLGYMRPLAIWSIQYALEKFHPQILSQPEVNGTTDEQMNDGDTQRKVKEAKRRM